MVGRLQWFVLLFGLCLVSGRGEDTLPAAKSAEVIASETRPSLVTITLDTRSGEGAWEGSGFVVGPGIIATNLHVIGEARPINVTTSDGVPLTVKSVHASDRRFDLALLRVEEEDLPMLPLGDSTELPDGLSVVAMGNPQGFRFSVVEGIISATREMDEVSMIQLAIPIEPGNSGGPLLDRQGRVIGIPTMRSQVSENIGFAMPVNALKLLLEKPNPIPIERWVTVGRLNERRWQPLQEGARWRQRAGTVSVSGKGAGFGGRALCLFGERPQRMPYEVEVSVRLGDESGAGGLVFASDGQDKHYGFYPSGGQLRLTHFAGPDVFSWSILADVPVASYRPGEWNHLRIVVEEKWITGYVNGDEVVRVEDVALRGGQVGLCKFRETEASFQGFSLGEPQVHEEDGVLGEALASWLEKPDLENQRLMEADPEASRALLQNKIASMEKQVETLRAWAVKLHHQRVIQAMKSLLDEKADAEIDLFHAGLLIAYLNNEDLDVTAYREEFEAMADEVRATLTEGQSTSGILETLSSYLFQQLGFHGSRSAYYSRQNSYLNAVLEDREGIPITLAVVFIELSRRLGVNDVVGMPLPGHFVVQHRQDAEVTQWIDVYDGGNVLSSEAAEALVMATTGQSMETLDVPPATKRQILVRMLRNLIRIDLDSEDATQALPELDLLLSIAPEESSERLSRALLLYQSNQWEKALEDLEWLLREQPPGVHLDRLEELRQRIETAFARQP